MEAIVDTAAVAAAATAVEATVAAAAAAIREPEPAVVPYQFRSSRTDLGVGVRTTGSAA